MEEEEEAVGEPISTKRESNITTAAPKKTKKKSKKLKIDHLIAKPFKLSPACFSLQRNEKTQIKARFRPTEANFHYEKIVLVCDNGEVRWIALKGIGIDQKKQEIVSVKVSNIVTW
jgi:hypothetical protein